MKTAILMVYVLAAISINGCANYSNLKQTITTTNYPDGRIVVVQETCDTQLYSSRDVKGAGLKIAKGCTLTGGAEELNASTDIIKLLLALVAGAAK